LVVLDRGQVVEEGQHEELLAKKGAYYRLDRAQTESFNGGALPKTEDEGDLTNLPSLKEI
jgi:ATP-binding cassette, subfamily B, bacterial